MLDHALSGCGLRRIWELSVPAGSVLRGKGLIAVGLQNSLMIWINKKPINLGPITGNCTITMQCLCTINIHVYLYIYLCNDGTITCVY